MPPSRENIFSVESPTTNHGFCFWKSFFKNLGKPPNIPQRPQLIYGYIASPTTIEIVK